MSFSKGFLLLTIFAGVIAKPHELMENGKSNWVKSTRVSPDTEHLLVWAIKQNNVSNGVLHDVLMSVSDPESPKFRQHLSFEEIGDLVRNDEATKAVEAFLNQNEAKILKKTPHGEYIQALAPISVWEKILSTSFHNFDAHQDAKEFLSVSSVVRTDSYTMPKELEGMVSFVGNTCQLPARSASKRNLTVIKKLPIKKASAEGVCTPDLLNQYYHIDNNTASFASTQAVFETGKQYYSPSDLSDFNEKYNIPAEKVAKVIGGHNSSATCDENPNDCQEANLDVQYITSVAQGAPTTFWYIDAHKNEHPFIFWLQSVASTRNPPLVHSISYGQVESDTHTSVLSAFTTEAAKLGVRGVTIIASSGDDGVANSPARYDKSKCGFYPNFPAAANYVTSLGATQGPENNLEEIACQSDKDGLITTGGGFSTYFKQQIWQSDFVNNYTTNAAPLPPGAYNTNMRGFPDVAIMGHNYAVNIGGELNAVSGTSASAPVFAAMVTLVNTKMLEANRPSVGWLNPALYKLAASNFSPYNDISTPGENNCCAKAVVCCDYGFHTAVGWDPLTGLGSVDFQKFLAAYTEL